MSRISKVEKDIASPEVVQLYDKIERNGARIVNLYKVLSHNPGLLQAILKLGNTILSKTQLSPKLRELAILRIAVLTGSEYEWDQHVGVALEVGLSTDQTESTKHWEDSGDFDDLERIVLRYTDEVAQYIQVRDETFKLLREYLSEQEVLELTVSIGYWGMLARVLVPLDVEVDEQSSGSINDLIGRRN